MPGAKPRVSQHQHRRDHRRRNIPLTRCPHGTHLAAGSAGPPQIVTKPSFGAGPTVFLACLRRRTTKIQGSRATYAAVFAVTGSREDRGWRIDCYLDRGEATPPGPSFSNSARPVVGAPTATRTCRR